MYPIICFTSVPESQISSRFALRFSHFQVIWNLTFSQMPHCKFFIFFWENFYFIYLFFLNSKVTIFFVARNGVTLGEHITMV